MKSYAMHGRSMKRVQRLVRVATEYTHVYTYVLPSYSTGIGLRGNHDPDDGLRYSLVPMGNYGVVTEYTRPTNTRSSG